MLLCAKWPERVACPRLAGLCREAGPVGLQPQPCPGRRGRDPPTDSYISNVQRTDASRIQALWGQFSCTQMVRRPVIAPCQ